MKTETEEMLEAANPELHEALELLRGVHAGVWMHFDPTMKHGDRKQPKEIKELLKEVRGMLDKHGMGFGEDE